jgi:hypothetical protein
LFGTHRNQLLS